MIPSDGVGDNQKRLSENEQCIRVDHDPRDSICVHDRKVLVQDVGFEVGLKNKVDFWIIACATVPMFCSGRKPHTPP